MSVSAEPGVRELMTAFLTLLLSGCASTSIPGSREAELAAVSQRSSRSPDSVVERQLDAYNKRDLEGFLATYSDDVALVDFPDELLYTGKREMRARYGKMFRDSPALNCEIVSKMILGNTVIYHERVTGRVGGPLEVLAIYSVRGEKITRVEFVRQ